MGSQNKLAFCAFEIVFFTIIFIDNQILEKVKCCKPLLHHKVVRWRDQKVRYNNQEKSKKQKQKNYLLLLKPRLIFIDEYKKIKLFICLDKVAVKEYD